MGKLIEEELRELRQEFEEKKKNLQELEKASKPLIALFNKKGFKEYIDTPVSISPDDGSYRLVFRLKGNCPWLTGEGSERKSVHCNNLYVYGLKDLQEWLGMGSTTTAALENIEMLKGADPRGDSEDIEIINHIWGSRGFVYTSHALFAAYVAEQTLQGGHHA